MFFYVLRAIVFFTAWLALVISVGSARARPDASLNPLVIAIFAPLVIPIAWGIWGTLRMPAWLPMRKRPFIGVAIQVARIVAVSSVFAGMWYLIVVAGFGGKGAVVFLGIIGLLVCLGLFLLGMILLVSIVMLSTVGAKNAAALRRIERDKPLTYPVRFVGFDTPFGGGVAFGGDRTVRVVSASYGAEDFARSDIRSAEWTGEISGGWGTVFVWFGAQRRSFRSSDALYEGPRLLRLAEEKV